MKKFKILTIFNYIIVYFFLYALLFIIFFEKIFFHIMVTLFEKINIINYTMRNKEIKVRHSNLNHRQKYKNYNKKKGLKGEKNEKINESNVFNNFSSFSSCRLQQDIKY